MSATLSGLRHLLRQRAIDNASIGVVVVPVAIGSAMTLVHPEPEREALAAKCNLKPRAMWS